MICDCIFLRLRRATRYRKHPNITKHALQWKQPEVTVATEHLLAVEHNFLRHLSGVDLCYG